MSLMDTIKGAREEAAESVSLITRKKDEAEGAAASEAQSRKQAYSRASAAGAKPTREVAGTVRNAAEAEPTKEEKKAKREAKRTEDDERFDAQQVVLKQQPGYKRLTRIWWVLLGVGFAFSLGSFLIVHYLQSNASSPMANTLAAASMVMMVAAYLFIIGAFILDFVKIRPMRNAARDTVSGASRKRLRRIIDEDANSKK
jgi:hypothetical protein